MAALLDDEATRAAVTAERSLLRRLSGGCLAPIAAHGQFVGGRLHLSAVVLSTDGTVRLHHAAESSTGDAVALGEEVAHELLVAGADRWIEAAR